MREPQKFTGNEKHGHPKNRWTGTDRCFSDWFRLGRLSILPWPGADSDHTFQHHAFGYRHLIGQETSQTPIGFLVAHTTDGQ